MARMGCALFILVALLVGYDQYRIMQLQNEVSAISGKVHKITPGKPGEGGNDLVTALAEAERHVKNAQNLLDKKKTAQAKAELDKVIKNLKSANTVSEDIVGTVADTLGKARDKTIDVFQKAWKDISEEAKTKKVDVAK